MWNWIKNFLKALIKNKPIVVEEKNPIDEAIEAPRVPISTFGGILSNSVIKDSMKANLKKECDLIFANKNKYVSVQTKTGVPWELVAAIHYRESSLDFRGVLHNGEKIIGTGKKTKLVPSGRGPFSSWEEAAVDALMMEKSKFPTNWTNDSVLKFAEAYNGLGYAKRNIVSPYVWAGTSKYKSGLYVADGKFSENAVDKRLGVAAIIFGLS